ncbi:GNAT family N-acetyltransferase [Spongisporangium articulatum]|uniref:GNAT family N-acetyltransferase n=1 Tax=Spongisporangium articulatum TaxID=3362603 RepID=A0ABW8AK67_9ACTN
MLTGRTNAPQISRLGGEIAVLTVGLHELSPRLYEEWQKLYATQSGVANPFASPVWATEWLRHFVPRGDARIFMVTERDALIGVSPMYLGQVKIGGLPLARRLLPVGAGQTTPLEIPFMLAAPGRDRTVQKAIVRHTVGLDVSWSEMVLTREQCWFDPAIGDGDGPSATFHRHQGARACVVLELSPTWDETRSRLKRNVKESLRRARNRLTKDGRPWRIEHRTGTDLTREVVDGWLDLHRARAEQTDTWSKHGDAYADPHLRAFMRRLLPKLGAEHQASIVELHFDGSVQAAQLVLHGPNTIYFHSSGFTPEVWQFSAVTALQGAAIERAIEHGDRWVNFSPGPNEGKLRWSETLLGIDEFAYSGAQRGAASRYATFLLAKDAREVRQIRQHIGRLGND